MNENNTKQNSKKLTRETALKLIDQKKSIRTSFELLSD